MHVQSFDPEQLEPGRVRKRRIFTGVMVALVTAPAVVLMGDLHLRTGYDGWKLTHLIVFTILFGLLAMGALQA